MNTEEFLNKWKDDQDRLDDELISDLDSVIQDEIEKRMPSKNEIIEEAKKRFPTSKPMNYLSQGQSLGFKRGAEWLKSKLLQK